MRGQLIVLAGAWTAMCATFAVAGWICDPGGLYDRAVDWWDRFVGLDDVDPADLVVRDLRPGEGR